MWCIYALKLRDCFLNSLTGLKSWASIEPLSCMPQVNKATGEEGGPRGPEPTRHGALACFGSISSIQTCTGCSGALVEDPTCVLSHFVDLHGF